jgi:hypothetical protein
MTAATIERESVLTESECRTITHGLRIAAERFTEHAGEFAKIATAIRAGHDVQMFAPGEGGATAADQLEGTFTRQAAESRALADRLDNTESVTLVPWTGDES